MQCTCRITILAVMLLSLFVCITLPIAAISGSDYSQRIPGGQKLLDGENEIRDVRVIRKDGRNLIVVVDYFYNGEGGMSAGLFLDAYDKSDSSYPKIKDKWRYGKYKYKKALLGKNSVKLKLGRASVKLRLSDQVTTTTHFRVRLGPFRSPILAKETPHLAKKETPHLAKEIPLIITWFPLDRLMPDGVDKDNVDELYHEAVSYIDKTDMISVGKERRRLLSDAKRILDEIMVFDPNYLDLYPELARYEMKMNGNIQGTSQAERILLSALKINPNHTNSLVLLGYVQSHQGKYDKANKIFERVNDIGTNNLWLFSNWAENYLAQGDTQNAIKMYKTGLSKPRAFNSHDRAKKTAYRMLISIYEDKDELEKVDDLFRREIKEFPESPCRPVQYADFQLGFKGGTSDSTLLAEKSLSMRCQKSYTNKVLAATYLSRFATAIKESAGDDDKLFLRAQALYPNVPRMLVYLAKREKTSEIIKVIVDHGVDIDARDSQGQTALIHAISARNVDAISRLLAANADINIVVGEQKITPLMFAVLSSNVETVELLLDSGADVNARDAFQLTAADWAQRAGKVKIYNLLKKVGSA